MLLLERNNARALYIATTDNDLATVASKIKTKCKKKQKKKHCSLILTIKHHHLLANQPLMLQNGDLDWRFANAANCTAGKTEPTRRDGHLLTQNLLEPPQKRKKHEPLDPRGSWTALTSSLKPKKLIV